MATPPTNPLVNIASDDVNLPSTGLPNKTVPTNALLTTGYDKDQTVFAEHFNYTLDNLSQWIAYLVEREVELQAQIEQERVSVGEIISITGDPTNPATLKGYGTWAAEGEGKVLVGVGSHTDDRGENKVWTDGQTEGEYRHVQTTAEIAQHNHLFSGTTDNSTNSPTVPMNGTGGTNQSTIGPGDNTTKDSDLAVESYTHSHGFSGTTDNIGNSDPANNIQPSMAVYFWKRVS